MKFPLDVDATWFKATENTVVVDADGEHVFTCPTPLADKLIDLLNYTAKLKTLVEAL